MRGPQNINPKLVAPRSGGPALADLMQLLGKEKFLALVEHSGGRRMNVPCKARLDTVLARVVGLPAYTRIVELWGGTRFNVPVARSWRVCALRAEGLTYPEIAKRLSISEQTVQRLLMNAGLTRRPGAATKPVKP